MMKRNRYRRTLKETQTQLKDALMKLQVNPEFEVFLDLMREGRDRFYREACQPGITQKDQDKFLGAAEFADQTITNATQVTDT